MANFLERRVSPKTTSIISLIAIIFFLPFLLLVSYQTVSLLIRALGTPANIIVDTKTTLEDIDTTFFHAFAQGGEESTDMLAPVVSEVRALKPRLIRLDHIYDHYNVVTRSDGSLAFDWSRLDAAIDTISQTGAKPLLSLSFMPAPIAKDGNITSPPENWDEWSLVVQKTIEHYSGKNQRNITGVFYEVWNEPDLAQFGKWSVSDYITLYRYASIGANNATSVNRFFLGGPGTTGLYKNWILALVQSGNRVDFLSWHSYLENPTRFNKDQRDIISWLLPYPNFTLIPKLITEFGFTGGKDKRYGTTYAAAHTAAVIRQLISGRPQHLFSFQLKDGPNQEDGSGWGLITHEDNGTKPKPRYSVFNFIDAMTGKRLLLTGEGSWVTGFASSRNSTIRVLLVNFDEGGSHSENVPVTLTNLDPGSYSWRERFLFGRDVRFTEVVTDGTLKRDVFMAAQSIAIIEISK
ncbi:hypothetical protein A3A79_03385 [Candidatus Gottesmanbacteria bacterium RIFCSPLOWO2_01_FULL_43_11b]|uniref:Glycosyl hydrolases family 39 N-terminal catalytic domain-containing protein n=1 Tax=Candidatus Gottesmanbacteria bacterium RIFCSPLOWO2_01_FULL_43_11b TaxID=1798392 RepID=A0A1F6AHN1_9BACT|nr:MAG: hypothetical protein A3A79_03385 [Candidatus Gottesmanbacteria bacterium RIFCSPLOWO2_01_FULL_43_11b]